MNVGDVYRRDTVFSNMVHYIIIESAGLTACKVIDVYHHILEDIYYVSDASHLMSRGHVKSSFVLVDDPVQCKLIKMLVL